MQIFNRGFFWVFFINKWLLHYRNRGKYERTYIGFYKCMFSFRCVLCRWDFTVKKEEMNKILEDFGGDLSLPENFERTAPIHDPNQSKKKSGPPSLVINPQTSLLCTMLDLTGHTHIIVYKIVLKRFEKIVQSCWVIPLFNMAIY